MSSKRILVSNGHYHVMSRIAHREFFLGEDERTRLAGIVKRSTCFCALDLMAYSIMSNHFHLEVHVPEPRPMEEPELLWRFSAWKGNAAAQQLAEHWDELRRQNDTCAIASEQNALIDKMFDLSKCMQLMKEWYSTDFNERTGQAGTLWEGIFKSVILEPGALACGNVAAYIDLNAKRAGMCDDPSTYEWCSFYEACTAESSGIARQHYMAIYGCDNWESAKSMHIDRMHHLERIRRAKEHKYKSSGKMESSDHYRMRAFTDGVILGSKAFINRIFGSNRSLFPASRQEGAKKVPGDIEGLFTLREVRDFRRKAPSAKDLASPRPPSPPYICSEQMYMSTPAA